MPLNSEEKGNCKAMSSFDFESRFCNVGGADDAISGVGGRIGMEQQHFALALSHHIKKQHLHISPSFLCVTSQLNKTIRRLIATNLLR